MRYKHLITVISIFYDGNYKYYIQKKEKRNESNNSEQRS